MSDKIALNQTSLNTYDEMPYESYSYAASNPSTLSAIAKLFGMEGLAPLDKMKLLELGCASGGNIIPLAIAYPNSKFVGVDLSKVQIDLAKKHAADLNLKNIEFYDISITEINESLGKFDYIICHGVISWVPDSVAGAIFDVCGKLLAPKGLAYISYNTLPGWNMVRSIRDMMLYHSEGFETIGEKVQQSRLLLEFVKDSLEGTNTPYGDMLKKEAELLSQQPDHYLRHDHLEETNKQYYFSEFMKEASKRGLQYLGDSNLASMFLGNMPAKVVEKLQVVNDIVRTEQYMDFINNRRFRSTILCRNEVALNRSLSIDNIKQFLLSFKIATSKPIDEVKLDDPNEVLEFYFSGIKESPISTSSPIMKAILYTFAENWNYPLAFDKIVELANIKLPAAKKDDIEAELINNAMGLVLSGYITISTESIKATSIVGDKPKVNDLVRYQCEHIPGLWITNAMHEKLDINLFEKFAFRYMDGKHSIDELNAKMLEHAENGELTLSRDGVKIEDKNQIKTEMASMMSQTLDMIKFYAILDK